MKTTKNLMAMFFLAMGTMLMTACSWNYDEDYEERRNLSGEWYGDFGMFYIYEYRGELITFDSYDTYIKFYTNGTGEQVDYYEDGPYEYQYYTFTWWIDNGIVKLRYKHDHELDTDIYDYRMTNSRFSGRFGSSGTRFNLYKVVDYDWDYYHNNYWSSGYGYGCYDDWRPRGGYYYTKGEFGVADNDSLQGADEGKLVSRGNRNNMAK